MAGFALVRHVLAVSGLIILAYPFLLVATVLKPFDEKLAWAVSSWTAGWFWGYMQRHWEVSLGAKDCMEITGDPLPEGESAVVIANHLSYGDYYMIQALASRAGMLGNCRYFAKKQLVWIPLFGPSFWAVGMILVSRNWTNDQQSIEKAFARIKRNRHPAWIVLYPEGTRRTPGKLLKAQAFARLHGKKELDNVLLPRTKGFAATIKGLRDSHIKHVYDVTISYTSPQGVPSLSEQLSTGDLSKAGYKFRIHVNRHAIADLPADDEGLKTWCEEVWEEKDARLASFHLQRGQDQNS